MTDLVSTVRDESYLVACPLRRSLAPATTIFILNFSFEDIVTFILFLTKLLCVKIHIVPVDTIIESYSLASNVHQVLIRIYLLIFNPNVEVIFEFQKRSTETSFTINYVLVKLKHFIIEEDSLAFNAFETFFFFVILLLGAWHCRACILL